MTEIQEWLKCDSCVAQAQWLARSVSGELYFCGHHKNKLGAGLDQWAYELIELNKTEEAPKLLETAE
jgi:hypothetical protein